MAESSVHRRMKAIVRRELEQENYSVLEEPLSPPNRRIAWTTYRPDLLGYRLERGEEELVIVECETHPSMKRFGLKNHSSLRFQQFLFQMGSIRRILAVPQGRLGAVDVKLRREWEIWILGSARPMCRIGLLEGRAPTDGGTRRDGETRTSRRPNRGQTGTVAMEERYGTTVEGKPHPS